MRCLLSAGVLALAGASAVAQSCTTQSKMPSNVREEIARVANDLGKAVLAGDTTAVQQLSATELAGSFGATGYVVRTTADHLGGDSVAVTQVYELDANARQAEDKSVAEFSCPLAGAAAETDFAIEALPRGLYAFAMVEATGAHPYLLAFLLRQESGQWKMAGFQPRPRSAGGHDGLWFWTEARAQAKVGKKWAAWVLYGEAANLLRPATYVSSTNLDKLADEQKAAAPAELADGLSAQTPLVIAGGGQEFRVTALALEGTDDNTTLRLSVRIKADWMEDTAAAKTRNVAATRALVKAHPELAALATAVQVTSESDGHGPVVAETPMTAVQ